jgi:hypothetical protein
MKKPVVAGRRDGSHPLDFDAFIEEAVDGLVAGRFVGDDQINGFNGAKKVRGDNAQLGVIGHHNPLLRLPDQDAVEIGLVRVLGGGAVFRIKAVRADESLVHKDAAQGFDGGVSNQ